MPQKYFSTLGYLTIRSHQISERLNILRWMTYRVLELGRQEPGVLFLKLHCQVARGGRCKTQQDVCKLQQTWEIKGKVKVKVCFYIAQHPVRWTAQSALYFMPPPCRPVHSDNNAASPGSILARQLSKLGRQWRGRKFPIFETVAKGDSKPGSLDCKSGILPLGSTIDVSSPRQYALGSHEG